MLASNCCIVQAAVHATRGLKGPAWVLSITTGTCSTHQPDVDLVAGTTVALVGSSGSGKSTVVGLIERFYDPVEGRVLLDGRDIRTLKLSWLRSNVSRLGCQPGSLLAAAMARQSRLVVR